MTGWGRGRAQIEELLAAGSLERLRGQGDGQSWLDRGAQALATARSILANDPTTAFVVGYDAARHGCTALLVHQGLRPTRAGGHLAVERAVRAQFNGPFDRFRDLRRRRNEIEYPDHPGRDIESAEVAEALEDTERLLSAARQVLPRLQPF